MKPDRHMIETIQKRTALAMSARLHAALMQDRWARQVEAFLALGMTYEEAEAGLRWEIEQEFGLAKEAGNAGTLQGRAEAIGGDPLPQDERRNRRL